MELTRAIREPVAAARGLGHRVGRAVRRLRDLTRYALPSENELLGALGGRYGTFEEFLAAAARERRRLFVVDIPRAYAAEFFETRHPRRKARILREAERICAHRFDLLGSGPVDLGARLPWHVDFKSGRRWESGAYYADLQEAVRREFGRGWDVKVPWELSRFQHLPCLGQASWLSGDGRYYEEFRSQLLDWVRSNRTARGVNWTCTMDVAIRAVNWIWAYGFFRDEILADRETASLLFRSLFAHGRFIAANLERDVPATSNHYLADLVGLLFIGILFRGAPDADVWKGTAVAEIVRESRRQTYADGVDYEASVPYHRLTTEMLLTALVLAGRSGFDLPDLGDVVRARVDFVAHYTKPNGLAPQIGDNDDGRLQVLGEYGADRRDHRHLLAVSACAFGDRALMTLAGGRWEEAFWFFGERFVRMLERRPEGGRVSITGAHYPRGRVAILRADDLYAILDAGTVGLEGSGAHAHNDTLSVEIQAAGEDLVVDPGVGAYTSNLGLRDRFRATAAHNTVRVDGEEINPLPAEPFRLPGVDAPAILRFASRQGFDLVEAEHRGYLRLDAPVLHRRVLLLNKRTRRFVIEDHLVGHHRHRLEWFFHLDPRCEAEMDADGRTARCRVGEVGFEIRAVALPEGAEGRVEADSFSCSYGRVESSSRVHFEWTGALPITVRFAIAPGREAGRRRESPPGGAR
ncbi:MAG: alginate lyase family protein [Acidobacteriota bacterium]